MTETQLCRLELSQPRLSYCQRVVCDLGPTSDSGG